MVCANRRSNLMITSKSFLSPNKRQSSDKSLSFFLSSLWCIIIKILAAGPVIVFTPTADTGALEAN